MRLFTVAGSIGSSNTPLERPNQKRLLCTSVGDAGGGGAGRRQSYYGRVCVDKIVS